MLTFGDDRCTDLCTLLAEDVLAADRDLGAHSSGSPICLHQRESLLPLGRGDEVVDRHARPRPYGELAFPHRCTPGTLGALAKKYGVEVALHRKSRTIDHGTEVFFISPDGDEEQIGDFGTESANTAEFSYSMALLATEMLPTIERETCPWWRTRLRDLRRWIRRSGVRLHQSNCRPWGPTIPTTLSADRGKYVAVNFWSPTCSVCVHELPAIESVVPIDLRTGRCRDRRGRRVRSPESAGARLCGEGRSVLSDAER